MPNIEPITYSNKGPLAARLLVSFVEYITGRFWIERNYHASLKKHDKLLEEGKDIPFFSTALGHMKNAIDITHGKLENIPQTGPLVVVANHPFGILDGLALCEVLHARRNDFYVLTNEVLLKADRIKPWLLPIDDSETDEGTAKNKKSILHSMRHLQQGGSICVFPAGRLARPKGWFEPYEDLDWQPLTAHYLTKVKGKETGEAPTLLPIFFEGENSTLFRIAAMLKAFTLTRSLVMNECKNKAGKPVRVRIGTPITPEHMPQGLSHEALAAWMREQCLELGKN